MSLTYMIDDHVGTPTAETSPVRSLYPKLKSMTPSPRRTSPLPPYVLSMDGAAGDKQSSPTCQSLNARLGEPEAPLESPDRSHSSSPRPWLDDVVVTKQDPSSTTGRYSESPLKPHVDDGLDSDGERYHSLHVGDMDDSNDESDGDVDLNGAISEYDSAQESLDVEESIELPLEMKVEIDEEDKENDDPNGDRKNAESQSAKDMDMTKGKIKAIDDEGMTVKDDEDEDNGSMKKDAMSTVLRPKSKKRKLRQAPTVFSDEMDEKVDMYAQPAKNDASKQLHRKQKNKNKSRMH
ncbi:hypothetical protein BG015_012074 [Linnemannia schmuckeri]|uniref:Uncharacterized protein n=1 Tax=Linnemannia schmuckeri TaxID=64567 RepID=A0A9P5RRU7_9FUNG|nr:hypothetical protein BG015_012074 [Linnemannia schmuckeri]